ncbi:MAG: helix-turn-helix transcriptional regulator [Sporomusaceae bacterium]|nr:helix-turn-helix transcriptional regulator [Sporomusaceae bacterium]
MSRLGEQLQLWREAKGLSQNQLAAISHVPQSAISEIESGKRRNPGIYCLQQLAGALNVNLLELIQPDRQELPNGKR